ncbi:MAG: hypothetical protein PHY99_08450 [Bacteroidales bacterium]|nr:hypothetical protein [Bacteroidales bacterium]
MTNLSTLYILVSSELTNLEEGHVVQEFSQIEEMDSDLLVRAPESAVRNILGFARSYTSMPSKLLDEIEIYQN